MCRAVAQGAFTKKRNDKKSRSPLVKFLDFNINKNTTFVKFFIALPKKSTCMRARPH